MPPITGYFNKVVIPAEVKVGDKIPLRVNYYARNEGSWQWKSAIMAKMGTAVMIVSETKELGQEGGGADHTYDLFPMPNSKQTISVRLFGHDDILHVFTTAEWSG